MDANREEFEQMRVAFERAFGPMPRDCTWTGFGYCSTSYNGWGASIYAERFKGFIAGQAARRVPAVPVQLPEYGIDTANHAGVRVRGFTEQQVRQLLGQ